MSNQYPNQNSDAELVMPFMTDEEFVAQTGGLRKEDIHPLLVDMSRVGPVGFAVTGDDGQDIPVGLTPGNLANGTLLPELRVETAEAVTTFKSYPGTKCAISVEPFGLDATVNGSVSTKHGIEIQDEADFKLVPSTHWRALLAAKIGIEQDNGPAADERAAAARRGGFIRRLTRRKRT